MQGIINSRWTYVCANLLFLLFIFCLNAREGRANSLWPPKLLGKRKLEDKVKPLPPPVKAVHAYDVSPCKRDGCKIFRPLCEHGECVEEVAFDSCRWRCHCEPGWRGYLCEEKEEGPAAVGKVKGKSPIPNVTPQPSTTTSAAPPSTTTNTSATTTMIPTTTTPSTTTPVTTTMTPVVTTMIPTKTIPSTTSTPSTTPITTTTTPPTTTVIPTTTTLSTTTTPVTTTTESATTTMNPKTLSTKSTPIKTTTIPNTTTTVTPDTPATSQTTATKSLFITTPNTHTTDHSKAVTSESAETKAQFTTTQASKFTVSMLSVKTHSPVPTMTQRINEPSQVIKTSEIPPEVITTVSSMQLGTQPTTNSLVAASALPTHFEQKQEILHQTSLSTGRGSMTKPTSMSAGSSTVRQSTTSSTTMMPAAGRPSVSAVSATGTGSSSFTTSTMDSTSTVENQPSTSPTDAGQTMSKVHVLASHISDTFLPGTTSVIETTSSLPKPIVQEKMTNIFSDTATISSQSQNSFSGVSSSPSQTKKISSFENEVVMTINPVTTTESTELLIFKKINKIKKLLSNINSATTKSLPSKGKITR